MHGESCELGWNVGLPEGCVSPPPLPSPPLGWVKGGSLGAASEVVLPWAPSCSPMVPKQGAPGTGRLQQPPADSRLPSWKGCYRIPGMCLELRKKIPKITSINT